MFLLMYTVMRNETMPKFISVIFFAVSPQPLLPVPYIYMKG